MTAVSNDKAEQNAKKKYKAYKKGYSKKDFIFFVCVVLIVNLVLLCVWLFTANCDKQFAEHFTFASTVTSIILSVLAIFLSITGESKTQTLRDRIEQEAMVITEVTGKLQIQMEELTNRIEMVQNTTDIIKGALSKTQPKVTQLASGDESSLLKKNN